MGKPSRASILARELLDSPREAGTEATRHAEARISSFLQSLGYAVETQRFSFSTAGLLAFPVFGAGLGWLALLEIPLLSMSGVPSWAAALVWYPGLLSSLTLAGGLGLGWATMGGETREDANLIATRPGQVNRWIVAHIDTKSQGHSMAGRLVAVWIAILAAILMSGIVLLRLRGPVSIDIVAAATAILLAAGFLAGRGKLKGHSNGARDNGSGVLAALVAAERVTGTGTGILITSAEEFGLIGARYFAEQYSERLVGSTVINIDTVDEQGAWRIVTHNDSARELSGSFQQTFKRDGLPVRQHRLPAGILVDSLPLAKAGAVAITLARLDWGTLKVIHTPRDTLEGLTLTSAITTGELVGDWCNGFRE